MVFDSSYFKNIDGVEAAIERSSKLQDIDARVKEEHLDTLSKFYKVRFCEFIQLTSSIPDLVHLNIIFQCFESIQKYGADLVQLFDDLESGKFIQQNFDNLLRQEEGKQLLTEVDSRYMYLNIYSD